MDDHLLLTLYAGDTRSALVSAMLVVTALGSGWVMLALLPLFAVARTRRFAAYLSAVVLIQCVLVFLLKWIFGRVRPWQVLGLHPPFDAPTGSSFPSGHAAGAFSVALFLVTVWGARKASHGLRNVPNEASVDGLRRSSPERRATFGARVSLGQAALVCLAALIGLSRVVLGVHYPSDVVAGALFGGILGWCGGRAYLRHSLRTAPGTTHATTVARVRNP